MESDRTYKVVECSTVTEDELERLINESVGGGWSFEGMQFAMREASKRPAMAFLIFTRVKEAQPDLKAV